MTDPQPLPFTKKPLLHLVYAGATLPALKPGRFEAYSTAEPREGVSFQWTLQTPQRCLGSVSFDGHRCQVAGMALPLPHELIDRTVMISPWPGQVKAAMRHHRAHLSLAYEGGSHNPIEQMIALYTLASAFQTEDLLGIINPNAWTAHPPADFLSADQIERYRHEIPFPLWVGYVRFYVNEDAFWLVTKGHHIFDVPDLAYFVEKGEDPQAIIQLFINVFHYLYAEDVFVTAGDTLEVSGSGQVLHFVEVSELEDALMGPAGTLVITHQAPKD